MGYIEQQDIGIWVNDAPNQSQKEFRQAVHTILTSISSDAELHASMVLKGGILLAIRYKSDRHTKDLDLSTDKKLSEDFTKDFIVKTLNNSLAITVEELPYNLACKVQSARQNPKDSNSTYPTMELTVGYAYQGTPKHKRLLGVSGSPTVVSIDYSLNEAIPCVEEIAISHESPDSSLKVYSLADLIAEKYRSFLQQKIRDRQRRQDIYDINLLDENTGEFSDVEKIKILTSLIIKCKDRGLDPNKDSMDCPELKRRAIARYPELTAEVPAELPDFEIIFSNVQSLYKSLPWTLKDKLTDS